MRRRSFALTLVALPLAARAHHGWSSFDQGRPIYLEGRAVNVAWRNPHAELDLDVAGQLKLPADLAQRKLPAQSASVDGMGLLKAAQLPTRKDRRWHIELAPLSRLEAWRPGGLEADADQERRPDRDAGLQLPWREGRARAACRILVGRRPGRRHALGACLTLQRKVAKAARAASSVASISAAPCAALTKPASYSAGAR